eukprot:TRINITY_DN41896_c0_g1_i2.p2 TRINITY_DN41896_c0_g1~~TRINITY_DN41896_c0_g1_i2.p2  ORF type:complete len:165 (+),score=17.81 TRINITY_DN41896_c0_g1_i2:266-760(+)
MCLGVNPSAIMADIRKQLPNEKNVEALAHLMACVVDLGLLIYLKQVLNYTQNDDEDSVGGLRWTVKQQDMNNPLNSTSVVWWVTNKQERVEKVEGAQTKTVRSNCIGDGVTTPKVVLLEEAIELLTKQATGFPFEFPSAWEEAYNWFDCLADLPRSIRVYEAPL